MSTTPPPLPPPAAGWLRFAPGLHVLLNYRRDWLARDVVAGLVLSAILVPVGMGYAEAAGVPAIHGLYATIVPLLVYALLGPSRIMVLGPDSTLAAVIASLILPLAGGSVERAIALAGVLALMTGGFLLLIGFARLGVMADLFSKPIRLGFFNAIALTVMISQMPKLLGFSASVNGSVERVVAMATGFWRGHGNPAAMAVGLGCLAIILGLRRWRPRWPGVLIAVVLATAVSAGLDLAGTQGLDVIGPVPHGLPLPALPFAGMTLADLRVLAPGAAIIALLAFADTSVLSRALAQRGGTRVNADQEMLALGSANLATGLFQGFPISSSNSRTPVAAAAGAQTQLANLVGAAVIALLLVLAPGLLKDMPQAALGAVVITACITFTDWPGMLALLRQRPVEFMLAGVSFLGVVFFGVIEGIAGAIALSLLVMVWNAWHPYYTVLVRVNGRKGYHDATRHPEGRFVPGLVLFRWDEQLFFANADLFREAVLQAVDSATTPTRQVIVAAEAVNDIDVTAADMLAALDHELQARGIELQFAGLPGHVRDLIMRYGLSPRFDAEHFHPTVGNAVNVYRRAHAVDWKDWDEA
ncbi:SulP family inorganic anion transporter [Ottowia sp.]|uniref:SulP family inorganic anion transporter n=1 Tax=Ottowia sp. TaxID=1898956 RepID=UPI002D0A393D|nr:SulP family inorganic anion transporter [Ottowia sp.]HOB66676.1 SulP family inorganic anion transporter [Ottowia sp.]HPZ57571.1 SulP family inorganic anion transporter [Ottowia sp.]HQD47065.1 SulP family inorganic anion transporter [Ottowia sp.]